MGTCIICGTSTDGPICDVHQEDVVFEFEGEEPSQLTPGRFYRGTVDGYADFGVFVDIGEVTGLLHRSKLDRRLESLGWDVGAEICVQVTNIRDNGDIDLDWSIRQDPAEFRGVLIDAPDGDYLADEAGDDAASETSADDSGAAASSRPPASDSGGAPSGDGGDTSAGPAGADRSDEAGRSGGADRSDETGRSGGAGQSGESDRSDGAGRSGGADRSDETERSGGAGGSDRPSRSGSPSGPSEPTGDRSADDTETAAQTSSAAAPSDSGAGPDAESRPEPDADVDRIAVDDLREHVGDVVRLEGEIVSVRQTSGPTVFELRDETGVVDCAAFVEAGVRAYPEVEADDVVRLDGEVRLRRDEIQVETESLAVLEDGERRAVVDRMDAVLDDRASPDDVEVLADDDAVAGALEDVTDVATRIRRAVLESRPVVVRHDATTDGYVAGAAIERAVLPLVEDQHASADAVYHYFDRRPLEDGVYDMNDATKDATRMLGDRERHDEKLPLFVFAAAGSTAASADGLELLDVYGAPRVVLDGRPADPAVADAVDAVVTVADRTATTAAATVAAAVNDDVRADLRHLPAVSFWDDAPESYVELAAEADVDGDAARELREAVALEAYYQSYEDKRELIVDLLFEKRTGLAEQVSGQFRTKLEAELDTATANIEERAVDGATVAVLDTDAYTHRYDFPPTRLLLDELDRRLDADAVVGVGTDELHVRSGADLDLGAVVDAAREAVPEGGVSDPGARQPTLEFLAGERDGVVDAVVEAVAEQVATASAR